MPQQRVWPGSNTPIMHGKAHMRAKRKRARGQFPRRRALAATALDSTSEIGRKVITLEYFIGRTTPGKLLSFFFLLESRAVQRRKSGDGPNLSGALSGGRNLPRAAYRPSMLNPAS